jgi:hypothetical protein
MVVMVEAFSAVNFSLVFSQVDAMKRVVVKRLPSTLILHLKRLEYNLQDMSRNKINDFCSFDTHIRCRKICRKNKTGFF